MKIFKSSYLELAHRHTKNNYQEIMSGRRASCFYCFNVFSPRELLFDETFQLLDTSTVCCPKCGIDSVLGEKSGFPIDDMYFVEAMGLYFFNGYAQGHKKVFSYYNLLKSLKKKFQIIGE